MRMAAAVAVLLATATSAGASQSISAEDAEAMRLEALADRAPDNIHGPADFVLREPDADVDRTTGRSRDGSEDCSNVPIRTKRGDGAVVVDRVDMCD
jgi:hypothetical protein